jgi:hypothetical protein
MRGVCVKIDTFHAVIASFVSKSTSKGHSPLDES